MKLYADYLKRGIDFVVSSGILIASAPVLLIVVLILFISNKGNVLFIQKRPGKNGRIFKILKLKTMTDKKDGNGNMLPDEMRITTMGKIVRKYSLDEIPQMINVLAGDMSLIGPRPLLPEYLLLYNDFQSRRHEVRPGITGWAQVNGRNSLTWDEKFKYDVWYVDNISAGLDFKIALLTLKKVFKQEGINSSVGITMERFTGNSL